MPSNQYITNQQFAFILEDLNLETSSVAKQQDLLDRATGDLESDLSEKFVVPLTGRGSVTYPLVQQFARMKVLNAIKAKIRELIGYDKARNLVIESTERFINTHEIEYKKHIKSLLESKIDFGFRLLNQAADGAREPVQFLGLAKPNNKIDPIAEDGIDPL